MALVNRLTRLFQADFHAVLDRIEEPDLQLRQAVREMQFSLDQERQRLKLLRHEAEQLTASGAAAKTSLAEFDEELDICLAAKKDDLARDLVRRKLGVEKRAQVLQQQADNVAAQIAALEKQVEEQERQLASMQQKLELLVGEEPGPGIGAGGTADAIRNEEVEIALLREKQRRAKS